MAEERITRIEEPGEGTHTHTTVIADRPRRGGGGTWLIAIVLLVAALVAFLLLGPMSGAEVAKDNAIAGAADSVGTAAQNVGEAAQDAADSLQQ